MNVVGQSDRERVLEMARAATADPDRLASALRSAEPVPQALVLAHLTGDFALLDKAAEHVDGGWSFEQHLPRDLAEEIARTLAATVTRLAEGSLEPPPLPDAATFARILSAGINTRLPRDYAEMMLEELPLSGGDRRSVDFTKVEKADLKQDVAIIGAGLSGLCLGAKLLEAGIPFVIYEKNHELGGTWFENRYAGAGVDIPSHFYSYSFDRKPDWKHHFAKRDEIFSYLRSFAEKKGLLEHIRFGVEVEGAHFDERSHRWSVTLREGSGVRGQSHSILVSAVGQLNRPSIPELPGADAFSGQAFHTAQWPDDVQLENKRVALVGTGASAIQVGPAIAESVRSLTIFQRSPNWAAPNPNYHKAIPAGEQWALANVPYLIQWYRFLVFWASGDTLHDSLQKDPDWPYPARSLNAENEKMRVRLVEHIRRELGDRTDLIEKVTPDYPPYGKRMLRDNNWYGMLRRDNVELVNRGVDSLDRTGLLDDAGGHHPCDVIIYSTGFKATELLASMDIRGRAGRQLRQVWHGDDARAYLGMTVPGFPNFFIMYGPNTNLAHGGSLFFHAECQARHIMMLLREMAIRQARSVEVRSEPFEEYNRRVDEAHARMVWTHGGMRNWYKNSKGRVVTNSPWKLVEYWHLTRDLDPDVYTWCTDRTGQEENCQTKGNA